MSEYKHTVAKQQSGGFSQSPDQTQNNSGNPTLDDSLTIKNGVILAVGISQGRRVLNAGFTATVGQLGNTRLDEAINASKKIGGYIALGIATSGTVVAVAALAEGVTLGITMAVYNHSIYLENIRIEATRGTRVNFGAGGHYG